MTFQERVSFSLGFCGLVLQYQNHRKSPEKKTLSIEKSLLSFLFSQDGNGTIENEELRGFLKDLLELVKKDYDATDLKDFEDTILKGCDFNRDGKINKKELTMILLALSKQESSED